MTGKYNMMKAFSKISAVNFTVPIVLTRGTKQLIAVVDFSQDTIWSMITDKQANKT